MSGPGSVVSIAKHGGTSAETCFQIAAIAIIGASFRLKRCLVFGDLAPVNSKNAVAGIRQRFDSLTLRPSLRQLKTGPLFGRIGGKPKVICARATLFPAARMTGAGSLIRMPADC